MMLVVISHLTGNNQPTRRRGGRQTYVVSKNVEGAVIAVGLLVETIPDVVFSDEMTGAWM